MSDHTIVIIRVIKTILVQFFCVFLPPLLNFFCFCWILAVFFFIVPIFAWNVPLLSPVFLKRSLVFPILLFSSISLQCSLTKAFLSLLAILCNSAFSWVYLSLSPCLLLLFFPQLFVKLLQTSTLPSCISFSLGWFWLLPPTQCYKPLSIVLQALCLPDLVPRIYSSPPMYNHKAFDLGHT